MEEFIDVFGGTKEWNVAEIPLTSVQLTFGSTCIALSKSLQEQGVQDGSQLTYVSGIVPKDEETALKDKALHGQTLSEEDLLLWDSIRVLTTGDGFNQSLEKVTLPSSLQALTFGNLFNQSLEKVTLPNSLQALSFGVDFKKSLQKVAWPSSLRSLTASSTVIQTLDRESLPSATQVVYL